MALKKGDIVFVHGTDLVSQDVETVTMSKYSHVAIYIGNGKVIDALGFRTVNVRDLSRYTSYDIYRFTMTDNMIANGINWLIKQLGRRYDYWDIFVLFVKCTLKLKIPWKEGQRIICSRLARDFLFACGLPIPDENMNPEDLLKWSLQHGQKVLLEEAVNE